jgi:hypothetical protein
VVSLETPLYSGERKETQMNEDFVPTMQALIKTLQGLSDSLTNTNRLIEQVILRQNRHSVQLDRTLLQVQQYMSGRWHRRDGDAYGTNVTPIRSAPIKETEPPAGETEYANHPSRDKRPPNKR